MRLGGSTAVSLQPLLALTVAKKEMSLLAFGQNHRRAPSHKLWPCRLTSL